MRVTRHEGLPGNARALFPVPRWQRR